MKGQSEIAYLPKFPKLMNNLMMMMMTSILVIKKILKFKIIIMEIQTSTLGNRLLNMNTEGNDQDLVVTSSSYGTKEAVTKSSDNQEQITFSLQDVCPGRHMNIKRLCLPVLCGM